MSAYQKTSGSLKLKGTAAGPRSVTSTVSPHSLPMSLLTHSQPRTHARSNKKKKTKSSTSDKVRERAADDRRDDELAGTDRAAEQGASASASGGKTEAQRRFDEVQRKRVSRTRFSSHARGFSVARLAASS